MLLISLTNCIQIFREQLLVCDQDPEGIRYAKKFDLATRGLLTTIKKFRMMKTIVTKKTRIEVQRSKYLFAYKLLGKDVFETLLDLKALQSLSQMDFQQVNGKKSGHELLEEAVNKEMMERSRQIEDIIARQKQRADFLANVESPKNVVKTVVESQQGPPIVKKPAFLRRVVTSIKPRKEDITSENFPDNRPASPTDAAGRPQLRMSFAQVQAMLQGQSSEARESVNINSQEIDNAVLGDESGAGVAALARETGQSLGPRPPTGTSQLMQAMGSVRARLRAGTAKTAPPPPGSSM
jgi:hypothetical protein